MEPVLMTYAEVAALTGLKLGTLYSMVARKQIPYVRLSRRLVRFRRDEVLSWIEDARVPPDTRPVRRERKRPPQATAPLRLPLRLKPRGRRNH